jgi:thiamine biosynthesis protein ThiS
MVAVAVNAAVVPRAEWTARALAEGDDIEVLEPVGGG